MRITTTLQLAAIALLSACVADGTGTMDEDDGDLGKADSPNDDGSDQGVTRRVNCDDGDILQRALNRTRPGDTVEVSGVCKQTAVLLVDRVTVRGIDGAVIDGGGSGGPVLEVRGAVGAAVENLTLTNGLIGLFLTGSQRVQVSGVNGVENDEEGMIVSSSSNARIFDSSFSNNGDNGFAVAQASSAHFCGTIEANGNGDNGIIVGITASLNMGTFETISCDGAATEVTANNNGDDGVGASNNGSLFITGATVTANGNADAGFKLDSRSHLEAFLGTTLSASGNPNGFELNRDCSMSIFAAGGTTVSGTANSNSGLLINGSGSVDINNGVATSFLANGVVDISVADNKVVRLPTDTQFASCSTQPTALLSGIDCQ